MPKQQTALITGASSGIGKELAYIFAKNGYDLILVARSQEVLGKLADELSGKYAIKAKAFSCDFSLHSAALNLFNELTAQNLSIDILVNNAGYGINDLFAKMGLDDILGMIAVNITTLTELTYLLLPLLHKSKNGKILNVASTAAFQAVPRMAVYSATKAYILSFSEALAAELKNDKITVTALCPGPTLTNFSVRTCAKDSSSSKRKLPTMDAATVAQIGYHALMRGQRVVICGKLNKLLALAVRFSPRFLVTSISGYLMK